MCLLFVSGCSNTKITLPTGTEILTQRVFIEAQAERAELYYEDEDYVVWIIVNDPNTKVNEGKLLIREPRTGIEVGLEAD